jgi:hypothetical protein
MYTLKVSYRLEVEDNGSLYTTLMLVHQRDVFYKGQNYEGLTPKTNNNLESGVHVN